MDSLYPTLVSGSTERKGEGFSAFRVDGDMPEFIGSFTGMCLASVRKNPWFEDDQQWFLRALLAGMSLKGFQEDHRSRCHPHNYGTLRLWDKLGLGAKRTTRGDYISVTRDEASHEMLRLAMRVCKEGYGDIRAYAEKKMTAITEEQLDKIMPCPTLAFHVNAVRVDCSLT
ncbi:hypothetical protein CC53_gp084 [Rhizobium phage vB_RleS_L338C]|uniref:hypothetical protein n=1 Tax=Rhizobium phage vB_RleS_L338C TaxID=1414737 RepID=UPI0003D7E733|nr:hypothetical protein CC53_gp084 [Rhizobium phage vB_RleS_L338C]AHC30501.1 hypothetical protein L338C_084 [Rhizobium phage vB_RleS_L338C]